MGICEQIAKQVTATRLTDAITQDLFILYGQPIVPLGPTQDRSAYIEILVRYAEEERKLLPPGGFFEVLESVNLMSLLDQWVLNRVVRSLAGPHAVQKNGSIPRCSINLSIDSLYDSEFLAFAFRHVRSSSLPPGKLWFQITESDAQAHAAGLEKLLLDLTRIGCGFTLTSYTGIYIAPASLRAWGVGSVKIDGQLIRHIEHAAAFVRAKAIHLECKDHGIQTIAEMVESPATLQVLKRAGIDYAQGCAVAPPAPFESPKRALN